MFLPRLRENGDNEASRAELYSNHGDRRSARDELSYNAAMQRQGEVIPEAARVRQHWSSVGLRGRAEGLMVFLERQREV
ncbi:hypothetical protein F2P81_005257 [Scophthalmus maximus]|uniref:Uncharacterized protein n=1 Tax=Scophthalmus maximus TaxID=52904 RepID=A0A6A4T949_SCOMX|nr:hypothetical protein F2P81_005257 [Scophthalmus maximus]